MLCQILEIRVSPTRRTQRSFSEGHGHASKVAHVALCPCYAVEWERSRDSVGRLVFLTVLAGEAGVVPLRNELTWMGRESRGLSWSALYSCVIWIVYSELLFQHRKKTYQPQRLCPLMAEPPTPACPPASSQTHSGTCLEKEPGSGRASAAALGVAYI